MCERKTHAATSTTPQSTAASTRLRQKHQKAAHFHLLLRPVEVSLLRWALEKLHGREPAVHDYVQNQASSRPAEDQDEEEWRKAQRYWPRSGAPYELFARDCHFFEISEKRPDFSGDVCFEHVAAARPGTCNPNESASSEIQRQLDRAPAVLCPFSAHVPWYLLSLPASPFSLTPTRVYSSYLSAVTFATISQHVVERAPHPPYQPNPSWPAR